MNDGIASVNTGMGQDIPAERQGKSQQDNFPQPLRHHLGAGHVHTEKRIR